MGKSSKKARTAAPPVASPYMGMPGMPGMPMMYAMPHYMSPQPQGPQPQVEVLPWGKAKKTQKKTKPQVEAPESASESSSEDGKKYNKKAGRGILTVRPP